MQRLNDPNFFPVDLAEGASLRIRDLTTVDEMLALTERNLERLKPWENWAHVEQTRADLAAYTAWLMAQWSLGLIVPAVIELRGSLVGAVTARIDENTGSAELGYWIDADEEGTGLMTRAATAVVRHVLDTGVPRIELRASVGNTRSRALADRLGFSYEGTLRSAQSVGGIRHDMALYALVPTLT